MNTFYNMQLWKYKIRGQIVHMEIENEIFMDWNTQNTVDLVSPPGPPPPPP